MSPSLLPSQQNSAPILKNKIVQVNNKYRFLIFFNENWFQNNSILFWSRKFILKIEFENQKKFLILPNRSNLQFCSICKKRSKQNYVRIWASKTNWSLFSFFQLEYAFQESGLNDVITQTQVEVPHLNPTKVSEKMSCEMSTIFFPNLAYTA